jgi:hypothetical protein
MCFWDEHSKKYIIMIGNAFIVFQEFKKENPQKFDNLPVYFGQLEFRESLVKSLLGLDFGVKLFDFKSTCISFFIFFCFFFDFVISYTEKKIVSAKTNMT